MTHPRTHDLTPHQMTRLHYAPELWGTRHDLIDKTIWASHCADPGWLEKSAHGARPAWNSGLVRRALRDLWLATAALCRAVGQWALSTGRSTGRAIDPDQGQPAR